MEQLGVGVVKCFLIMKDYGAHVVVVELVVNQELVHSKTVNILRYW